MATTAGEVLPGAHDARERHLQFIAGHLPMMAVYCDTQTRYLFANELYTRRFGLAPADVVGLRIEDVLGAEAYQAISPQIEAVLRGEQLDFEQAIAYDAIGTRWVRARYVPDFAEDGAVRGFLAMIEDVTTRRLAEDALREEAKTLEIINEVGTTLAAERDLQRLVQYVTDAATRVTGAQFGAFFYNVTNQQGESYMLYTLAGAPREAFEKFGMPRNTAVFAPTFAGEPPVRIADVTKDARYGRNPPNKGMPEGHLPVRSYLAASVVSRSGEVLGGLFFGHATPGVFTERAEKLLTGIASQASVAIDNARLHDQHQQLIADLREADRRKDEFIATLSHELRNPLAPLRNSLHLIRLQGNADQVHTMMERQVNHLVRLVDDLLEISRISRGSFELRKERIELSTVVHNAVETSDPLLREAGHTLTIQLPTEPLWLEGDPVRLAQVLSNLLNNAARYTERGGAVTLTARAEDGQAAISVRDTGRGFDPATAAMMFEMFSRGDGSTGLGVGLALARSLVEMHGGTIGADSAGPGRGAEFTVKLPLADAAQAPAPAAAKEAVMGTIRILVVDDNADAAESLQILLELLGAQAKVARDGQSAIDLYGEYQPDAVLLDIGMPGMDGYEVARALRHLDPHRRTTIIALTGWGQDQDRERTRAAGFDHHLVKPVDVDALQDVLAGISSRPTDR
jgi:PAS domain S-box-containing protein